MKKENVNVEKGTYELVCINCVKDINVNIKYGEQEFICPHCGAKMLVNFDKDYKPSVTILE